MSGRLALVTGGDRGIGAASVRALVARGHRVAFTFHQRAEAAEQVAAATGAHSYHLDLRDGDEIADLSARLEREHGDVTVLVHNAGVTKDAPLAFLAEPDWDLVLDVNLKGVFRLTKALVKGMIRQRWGRIVTVASTSGVVGQLGQAHYAAAKGGVIALTKTLARELARFGVTANAVVPGLIDTEMLAAVPERKLAQYLEAVPLARLGLPDEVAALVAFLVADEAAYITGQAVRVDGGLVMA